MAALATDLRAARAGYDGEVHFCRIPRNFDGEYGVSSRTARAWFDLWREDWGRCSWIDVLAVNRRHTLYDGVRFGRPERAYLHFTALALRTGLATVFRDIPTPSLAIWSDERTGAVGRARRLAGELSFAAALRQAFAEDEARPAHSNPPVTLDNAYIQTLGSARSGSAFTLEQEMLQLTDLLLGAAATAIDPRTTAATKRHFAREMALVMEDVRMAPRRRSFGLHDHFLASYFPGPHGSLTSDGPIGVRAE